MIYSRLYFRSIQEKNILSFLPLFLIFALLLIAVGFYQFFVSKQFPARSTKAMQIYLERMEITNVSYNRFDIFWETNKLEKGWVIYWEKGKNRKNVALDIRDIKGKRGEYKFHLASVGGDYELKADTVYLFEIVSDKRVFKVGEEKIFQFKTPPFFNLRVGRKFAYGKVFGTDNKPLENAFVILNISDEFPSVVITKQTGEWLINLSNLVSKSQRKVSEVNDDITTTLEVVKGKKKSFIKAKVRNLRPLEPIVLGKNYDFTTVPEVLSARTSVTSRGKYKVDIIYPKKGAVIAVRYPLIKGTGIPGKYVNVTVKSNKVYKARVRVDKEGLWLVKVPLELLPGKHIISIETEDENGRKVNLFRNFLIAKSGESVLGEATSSAELESTPTPTFIPTSVPTLTPTPSSKLISNNKKASPTPTTPVTGLNINVFAFSGLFFMIIGLGFLVVF